MTSQERPKTAVRADVLAAKLFQDTMADCGNVPLRDLAAASFDAAAEFMREAARRNPLTGELLNEGLPPDVEERTP